MSLLHSSIAHSAVAKGAALSALLVLSATTARADVRRLYVWSGTVDREAIVVMRGASLETVGDGFEWQRAPQFRISEALPREEGRVRVERVDGRGEVDVIEQPTRANGYTARVRVRDRKGGADQYRFAVTWEPARRGDGGRGDDDRSDGDRPGYDRDRKNRSKRETDFGFGDRRDAGALRFSARVDDVAEIRIRGGRVDVVSRSGRAIDDVRFDIRGARMPGYAVQLDLRRFAGRGNVFVSQYPREWNNWTTIVRIEDSRGGADAYEFDLRW